MNYLKNKKIIILGGSGFLGKNLTELLKEKEIDHHSLSSQDVNLTSSFSILPNNIFKSFDSENTIVINLAANCGGIGYNQKNSVQLFEDNIKIIMNVFNLCIKYKVNKLVNIGTVCSYPEVTKVPFKEDDIWKGYPERTNAGYGIAKRTAFVLSELYNKECWFNSINLVLANLYGEHDKFDDDKSHVIPALIKKFNDSNNGDIVDIFGNGKATRDFLYVKDACNIIVKLLELGYSDYDPLNIGTGTEIDVGYLVSLIAQKIGHSSNISWDETKPNGQLRRRLCISKLKSIIGDYKFTNISDGLDKTIEWYRNKIGAKYECTTVK